MAESNGTYEITLGLKIGKRNEDVPADSPKKPYCDRINVQSLFFRMFFTTVMFRTYSVYSRMKCDCHYN